MGAALGGILAVVAAARAGKPLHPRGAVVPARMELEGGAPEIGALGTEGAHDVTARFSRATGLPAPLPDLHGLALRWQGAAGDNDVLLASTGTGPRSRYVLLPRRRARDGALTSLMPFAGPDGPVLLGALPTARGDTWELAWARPRGPWLAFGALRLGADPSGAPDRDVRFDPVLHCPDGLSTYPWAAALRVYPYRWSRRFGGGQAAGTDRRRSGADGPRMVRRGPGAGRRTTDGTIR